MIFIPRDLKFLRALALGPIVPDARPAEAPTPGPSLLRVSLNGRLALKAIVCQEGNLSNSGRGSGAASRRFLSRRVPRRGTI
jgi:hypothetical protein